MRIAVICGFGVGLILAGTALAWKAGEEDVVTGFTSYQTLGISNSKSANPKTFRFLTLDSLKDFHADPDARDKYGGLKDSTPLKASGFFRTEKVNNRWWLVDPDGELFLSIGMNNVAINLNQEAAIKEKFVNEEGWAKATGKLLLDNGFNTLGDGSDVQAFVDAGCMIPFTIQLNWLSAYGQMHGATPGNDRTIYPNGVAPIFDAGFEAFCRQEGTKLSKNRDDPRLLGYFSDQEPPFRESTISAYLKLPEGDAGHQVASDFMNIRHGSVTQAPSKEDNSDFAVLVADRYFRVVSEAIRTGDPNHLFLGARSDSADVAALFTGAGPAVDVGSIDYFGSSSPEPAKLRSWANLTQKPFLVSEFTLMGTDSQLANSHGPGWIGATQEDRGVFYQNWVIGLFHESKNAGCVGWHWYHYMDNVTEASNVGIVSADYTPYAPLLVAMKNVNERAYALRKFVLNHKDKPMARATTRPNAAKQ